MKKTGLNGYDDNFNVDYDTIAGDGILSIHKYFMKKYGIVWIKCLDFCLL